MAERVPVTPERIDELAFAAISGSLAANRYASVILAICEEYRERTAVQGTQEEGLRALREAVEECKRVAPIDLIPVLFKVRDAADAFLASPSPQGGWSVDAPREEGWWWWSNGTDASEAFEIERWRGDDLRVKTSDGWVPPSSLGGRWWSIPMTPPAPLPDSPEGGETA